MMTLKRQFTLDAMHLLCRARNTAFSVLHSFGTRDIFFSLATQRGPLLVAASLLCSTTSRIFPDTVNSNPR
jgi:hypothetical protein